MRMRLPWRTMRMRLPWRPASHVQCGCHGAQPAVYNAVAMAPGSHICVHSDFGCTFDLKLENSFLVTLVFKVFFELSATGETS